MILEKLIIHLKNVLFFKAVVYILLIIGLISLNPVANNQLEEILQKRDKARAFLEQATLKFESVQDFENKIVDIHNKYKDLEALNGKKGCRDRNNFIKKMKSFLAETNNKKAFDDFQIVVREVRSISSGIRETQNIGIKPYEGTITLKAKNYYEFSRFMRYMSDNLPVGSIITKCEITNQKTLTPDVISELSENTKPLLFYAKISVLFREINYDQ